MNKFGIITRRAWLAVFLVLALSYALHYSIGQAGRLDKALHFSPLYVIAIIAAQLVFWLIYSVLWRRLIICVALKDITLWESFRQLNLLNIGKYLPGKIWGVIARGASLSDKGVTATSAIVATCIEQTLVLHSAVVVSAILFASLHPSWATTTPALLSMMTLGLGSLLLKFAFRLYLYLIKPNANVIDAQEIRLISTFTYLKFALGHCLGWIVNGVLFASIYHAFFDVSPTLQLLYNLILANTIGVTLGFLAIFAPGGIGVREAATSGILTLVMPFEDAVMLAVLFRLWLLLTDILVGVLVLLGARHRAT